MTSADPLDRLPPDARSRFDVFARALKRISVDNLTLYVDREDEPVRGRAGAAAAAIAAADELDEPIDAARAVVADAIVRAFSVAQLRVSVFAGANMVPGLGPTRDRVRIVRSLEDR